MTAQEIISLLQLQPHPKEGGFFAETYRSAATMNVAPGARNLATAILYLITPKSFSEMHRLPGDEIFHFYLGDPVEMLQLHADGSSEVIVLGADIQSGMKLQHVVPGGVWQGSRLKKGGTFALLGTTMSPGFAYEDYSSGTAEELIRLCPEQAEMIRAFTRA
ncbi:MAG TPA: cupin domain-containing protein [Candidatus Angelobacter sp.]|nr:cupin domain-containing protein [Candidatus Angelobacter sp.]